MLAAQQRVELTAELAKIGNQLRDASQTLYDKRLGTENALLQSQVRAHQTQIVWENAEQESIQAWRRLTAVLGVPGLQRIPLAGELDDDLPEMTWEQCYGQVLAGNPELGAARARVAQACLAVKRAQREPVPNLDVAVSVRHHNFTTDDVANVQIGMPVPVFDRNQGNVRRAQAEWAAARQEVRRIEMRLQDQLAIAHRRFANAQHQTARYRNHILPKAKRSLDLVSSGYQKRLVEFLTLLNAQETYVQVSLSHLDSLRELRSSLAVIEGQLLQGSLSDR